MPEGRDGEGILDICCGAGEFASIASAKNPASSVVGIDMYVQELKGMNRGNLAFIAGDAERLPVKASVYDHVFCFHSFHHLGVRERWRSVLCEAARVLKPGGKLHVIDHHNGFLFRCALLFFRLPVPLPVPWMSRFKTQLHEERDILKYWLQNVHHLPEAAASVGLTRSRFRKSAFFFYACFVKHNGRD